MKNSSKMRSSRKALIVAVVLLVMIFFYYAPIAPADYCPSIIVNCTIVSGDKMSFSHIVESWIGFIFP